MRRLDAAAEADKPTAKNHSYHFALDGSPPLWPLDQAGALHRENRPFRAFSGLTWNCTEATRWELFLQFIAGAPKLRRRCPNPILNPVAGTLGAFFRSRTSEKPQTQARGLELLRFLCVSLPHPEWNP